MGMGGTAELQVVGMTRPVESDTPSSPRAQEKRIMLGLKRMSTEDRICKRYEGELAAIAALDRRHYLNPCPSTDERRNFAARQARLEALRTRLYAELDDIRRFRRCRSFMRGSKSFNSL
jgi:hypothetical protein